MTNDMFTSKINLRTVYLSIVSIGIISFIVFIAVSNKYTEPIYNSGHANDSALLQNLIFASILTGIIIFITTKFKVIQ
jgi:multisubunit Na+/H+ antiporter MnhC subunit